MNPKADLIIEDADILITNLASPADPLGRVRGGSVVVAGEHILAAGPSEQISAGIDLEEARRLSAAGRIVAPGFVDSHTHLVFGGSRVQEYAAKMHLSTEAIQALGIPTGILASVEMTRRETADQLFESAVHRLDQMLAHGTTTVESKSGYGLSLEHELKMLEVNRRLNEHLQVDVISTFLGAHAVPPDVSRAKYVDEIVLEMIPAVAEAGLAQFCDVYCDEGYFTLDDARRILEAGRTAGLGLKIHTDQYSDLGGAHMAAELGVTSADHLNYTAPETIRELAAEGVTGVLMPLIDFAVRHPKPFNAQAMREEGLQLALATDLCPGCWMVSMPLVIQFAARLHGFSVEAGLRAATVGGARALGLDDRGVLAPGMLADIQIWDLPTVEDLIYRLGSNPVTAVIKRGQVVRGSGGG